MTTIETLLRGQRYLDAEVLEMTPDTLSVKVNGVEHDIDFDDDAALSEYRASYKLDAQTIRIAQADPNSVPYWDEEKEEVSHPEKAWLFVPDPEAERKARSFSAASLTSVTRAASARSYAPGLTSQEIAEYPNLCALITETRSDGGQNSSRNGAGVYRMVHHHGATSNVNTILGMMSSGSRQVSSNLVFDGKRIIRVVNLTRRAWTSSAASVDAGAITYEATNSAVGDASGWPISADTQESIIKAMVALSLDKAAYKLVRNQNPGHRDLYSWWGVSYPTACPGGINIDRMLATATSGKVNVGGESSTNTLIGDDMAVIRVSDWNGRCYWVDSMGHSYIPDPKEIAGLYAISGQTAPRNVKFDTFYKAVARINSNISGGVVGKALDALKPKAAATRTARFANVGPTKPDWCEDELWNEAVKRKVV